MSALLAWIEGNISFRERHNYPHAEHDAMRDHLKARLAVIH